MAEIGRRPGRRDERRRPAETKHRRHIRRRMHDEGRRARPDRSCVLRGVTAHANPAPRGNQDITGARSLELTTDPALQAVQRLERALERLEIAIERRLAALEAAAAARLAESVPRAEVAALSARLDAALAQLRAALAEQEAALAADDESPPGRGSGAGE